MKKIIWVIILPIILITSCSKSFIELSPVSTIGVDALYKTDKDFQDALTGCYSALRDQYQDFWMFGDVRGDDSWQQVVKNSTWYFMDVFTTNSSDGLLRDSWQNYYRIVYRTNTILANVESVDPSMIPNKDRYVGEAKFLRAFAYFDLVRIFGDVPMVTAPVTIEESYKIGRKSIDSIYEKVIIPDFQDAVGKLPAKYESADVGRPTKGAATALLARVYMTRKDFVNAESTLKEVTTMGYSLLPDYNDLFDYAKDEHHSEYIFDIEYEEGIGAGSDFTNRFMPNSRVMADFYGIKGGLEETNSPTENLISLFQDGDLRKDVTVGTPGGYIDGSGNFIPLPFQTSQTYTKKYITAVATENDSRANWKVIRYADVLLMLAEALNENGKTSEALTFLNQVRQRAGLQAYSGLTQEDARNKIYLERRLELSFEGVRWFDLVRTGRALSVMQSNGMKANMTVFPIPLSQIQLINDPTLFPQNEGYD